MTPTRRGFLGTLGALLGIGVTAPKLLAGPPTKPFVPSLPVHPPQRVEIETPFVSEQGYVVGFDPANGRDKGAFVFAKREADGALRVLGTEFTESKPDESYGWVLVCGPNRGRS